MTKHVCVYFILITFAVSSCSHPLKVKNLGLYTPEFVNTVKADVTLGIYSAPRDKAEERIIQAFGNALKRDGFGVIMPYYPESPNAEDVDYIVNVSSFSDYKGSGWNFLINWPGFIIWTPAWHGYNYLVTYKFDIDITNTHTNVELPPVSIPMELIIRHAAMNRTWTEVSWLEYSVIAFIGGIVFTKYDRKVTRILLDTHGGQLSDYIASKIYVAIIDDMETSGGFTRVPKEKTDEIARTPKTAEEITVAVDDVDEAIDEIEKLGTRKAQGLISDDEYNAAMKQLLSVGDET